MEGEKRVNRSHELVCDLPVRDDDGDAETRCRTRLRNLFVPERAHEIERGNFEWDKQCLVDEVVPANHEAESIVNPDTSQTNEATRHRHVGAHLSDGVVNEGNDAGVEGVGDEQTSGTALGEAAADGDEQAGTDCATDGNQLNLTVVQAALEAIGVVSYRGAIAVERDPIVWDGLNRALELLGTRHGERAS